MNGSILDSVKIAVSAKVGTSIWLSTNWTYFLRKFCKLLRIKRNKFYASLHKTRSIAQHIDFYAKIISLYKNNFSAPQTPESLFKVYRQKKLWSLNWLLLVTKTSKWGTKINKIESRKLKIENWKLMHSFFRCLNLCVVATYAISNFDYF